MPQSFGCTPCPEDEDCVFFDVMIKKSFTEDFGIRYTTYIVGHCGYWFVNLSNIVVLLLVEGWCFGRLSKNFLSKLSLAACCFQICSCTSSIIRYNTGHEYDHPLRLPSVLLSIVAFVILSVSYLYVCSTSRRFVQIGSAFWILWGLGVAIVSIQTGNFDSIRTFMAATGFFQLASLFLGFRKLGTEITIKVINPDSVSKLFQICIFINVISLATNMTLRPIFYPLLGLTFTSNVIIMALVGTSADYMAKIKAGGDVTAEESQPLNTSA